MVGEKGLEAIPHFELGLKRVNWAERVQQKSGSHEDCRFLYKFPASLSGSVPSLVSAIRQWLRRVFRARR